MKNKYRIKVFPHDGRLLYVPQERRLFFFWGDIFGINYEYPYSDTHTYNVVATEQAAMEWIKEYTDRLAAREARQVKIKKFERDNPVRYIKVEL